MGVYWRKDRGAWVVRYTDASGKTVRIVTTYRKPTKVDEAKATLMWAELVERVKREKAGLGHSKANPEGMTLSDAARWWLEKTENLRSAKVNRYVLEKHIIGSALGSLPLERVTPGAITDWLGSLEVSNSTKRNLRMFLTRIYNRLEKYDLYHGSRPTKRVEAPKAIPAIRRHLQAEDVRKVLAAATSQPWQEMMAVALWAGLRRGEIFRLRVSDIDKKRWLMTVTGTKSGADRLVPIHEELRPYILRAIGREGSGLLWPGKGGVVRGEDTKASERVRKACERAGVEPVTFHGLRHTWATHLNRCGVNAAAAEAIGWSGAAGTTRLRTYTHHDPDFLHAEIAKLSYPEEG